MFIQFAGYDIEANSRIYNFDVMDPPREAREFTVEIESKMSRWGSLQLKDGPGICFERFAARTGAGNTRVMRRVPPAHWGPGYPGIPGASARARKGLRAQGPFP